ncbi:MAG: diguanylate cyclase [Ilumatobacteraceae bacterium]
MATSTDLRSEPGVLSDDAPMGHRSLRRVVMDVPVGRKLLTGFAALTLVLGLVVMCLFITVARLGDANRAIVDVAAKRSEMSDHLRFAAADLRAAQQAYVLHVPDGRAEFDQAATRFEDTLAELRMITDDPVEHTLVRKIATGYQTFRSTDQLIWQAMQDGRDVTARNLTVGAESLAFGFMAEDAEDLALRAAEDRRAAETAFEVTSSRARDLGVVLAVAALVVMALSSYVITRLIRDPLHRVQRAAERAADGDLSAEVDVHSDDETGRLARAFNAMLAKLRQREEAMMADHRRQELQTRVYRALEMSDDEPSALAVVGRSLAESLPGRPAELLLADNSKANLEQAVVAGPHPDGPGCPVSSPFSCVAVRGGAPVTFASSSDIDACPHLRDRGGEPCSAVCVPVTFMGRAIGVLHAVGDEHHPPVPNEVEALSNLSAQAGARIGMLRTMARTSLQAATDSLTGLMNRRTFQSRMRSMRRTGVQFSLVMADLDHFKRLNDTHGHEMGDRALTTFCTVAAAGLRHGDLMARWGGEEFAFALVGVTPEQAADALDRIRVELAGTLATSDIPGFTASYGVVDASQCASLDVAVRVADDALYEAKGSGRDRVVVADVDAVDRVTPPAGAAHPGAAYPLMAHTGRHGAHAGAAASIGGVRVPGLMVEDHLLGVGVLAALAHDDDPLDL